MATVNVSNWSEFVAAVAVAGDTVVLPEGAVWDMNSILPEGYHDHVTVNCAQIDGNGAAIKNLHLFGKFIVPDDLEINDLKMTNLVCEDTAFFDSSGNTRKITMNGSTFTGIFGVNTTYFNTSKMHMNRSVVNLDMTQGGSGALYLTGDTFTAIYSRITLNYPQNAAGLPFVSMLGGIQYCMLTADFIGCHWFDSSNFSGCVILGSFGDAVDTNEYGAHGSFVSVYDVDGFSDGFTSPNPYFIGVTRSQMHDAAYLASIGFPIGA